MEGQMNFFEYLKQKPIVGSTIFFVTAGLIKKATVINHDASFCGYANEKYFKVKTDNDEIWSIVNYYSSHKEAKKHIK